MKRVPVRAVIMMASIFAESTRYAGASDAYRDIERPWSGVSESISHPLVGLDEYIPWFSQNTVVQPSLPSINCCHLATIPLSSGNFHGWKLYFAVLPCPMSTMSN